MSDEPSPTDKVKLALKELEQLMKTLETWGFYEARDLVGKEELDAIKDLYDYAKSNLT